jgi:ABC-type dipeptide/oligopeptide/nickel transport system permease component
MTRFVISRVLQAALIVVLIAVSVFLILRVSAGDPAKIRAPVFARPDVIEQYRRDFGTDRPIGAQLASFFAGALLHGDLGQSFRFQESVTVLIARAFPKTLLLATAALALSLTIAVLLGSLAALHPHSVWGWLSSAVAALGQSAPVFWVGLVLVLVFAVTFPLLPAGGFSGPASLVLPAIAVCLSVLPTQIRVLRASMQATLRQEFIRTARAFGLSERRVLFVYALRNACLPLVTVIGVDIGYLFGGAIVAEVVFNYPGIGELALTALNARDYPLIQGITVVTASSFVLANLIIDLAYSGIDPRIRLEQP